MLQYAHKLVVDKGPLLKPKHANDKKSYNTVISLIFF